MIYLVNKQEDIPLLKDHLFEPFSNYVLSFFEEFSKELAKEKSNKNFPEILAYAFWIRKNNLIRIKKKINISGEKRLARGNVLHIPPANVPTGFLYSWTFGLVSGNKNIIKIPNKDYPQIENIIKSLNNIKKKKKFVKIFEANKFIKYNNENYKITSKLSDECDARLIWGGDKTIFKLKEFKTKVSNVDLCFSDRYSFSIFHLNQKTNIEKLCENFYNDTLTLDQNACSSPHMICWFKTKKKYIEIFWKNFTDHIVKKYEIDLGNKYLKFSNEILNISKIDNLIFLKKEKNFITRAEVSKLQKNIDEIRGKFGFFIEYNLRSLNYLDKFISRKYQTLSYEGISRDKILNSFKQENLKGIDRIVKTGNSLNMSFYWDGYDIVRSLTRIIDYE